MARLTVASLKGGVGKTSVAVSIAALYAAQGKSVLLCDVDSQANASSLAGHRAGPGDPTIADLLVHPPRATLAEVAIPDALPGVDLLPARLDTLTEAANRLAVSPGGYLALVRALARADEVYDEIVLDTPPTQGILSTAAVAASDVVLAVVNPARWAAEGATRVQAFVQEANDLQISSATFIGAVLNKVPTGRRVVGDLVLDDLQQAGVKLLKATIPIRAAVEQGEYLGTPVVLSEPGSDTAEAFRQVALEVAQLTRAAMRRKEGKTRR